MIENFARYNCQIALPGFGTASQRLLQQARVLIVGAGGLGCPASQYLAAAGIGTLGIADFDNVSESNLHRQVLFTPADTGKKKVIAACERLQQQNPGIRLTAHDVYISAANILDIISSYDLVVDCTDNFATRYLLNDAAVITGKPLIYGAIYQYEGQVAVWNIENEDGSRSPNYRDLFPEVDAASIPNCAEGGVIPTLAGIIGCMQANEAIKYFTKAGGLLKGRVLIFDAHTLQSRIIKIAEKTNIHITSLARPVTVQGISFAELKSLSDKGTVNLIDVRTDNERREKHIGGTHIPLAELRYRLGEINPNGTTLFYCALGPRSRQAAEIMKDSYPDAAVFWLEDGLDAKIEEN